MGEIINPYIAGAPVIERRMFFGRDDIFQWIEGSVAGQYSDHILVIHGQRRVGKTSVLKQLGNRLPKRYIPVFFDLQGRTHTTLDHFLWWLAREITRVLKQDRGIEIPPPEKKSFAADLEFFENQFISNLRTRLGDDTLLLTFDEFDNLEESQVKEELARPLIDHLRRLMGQPNLNFIFSIGSSGRKLENMQAAYTDFFKTALYKKISFLNEAQTRDLVARPVEGIIKYERAAIDRIYRITSGHPYFTQLACHELFARCQRTAQRTIAAADVEAVLDDVVERGTVNLKFVWDEASDIEKWALAALAQLEKADNRTLADYLRENHVRFSQTDLNSGVLRLREKDVLTSQNQFVVHLLRIWLQKNRPMEQAREELTEANPIASRFIEIGLEFRESGQHEKAIDFFRQALSVSAENLQAQVSIATTYAGLGRLEQAIIEFEKALTIDEEDVVSRAGLCDAYLAQGDMARAGENSPAAMEFYQKVLNINAQHTEARARVSDIKRKFAENALASGKDEEALGFFAEALKYLPEDAALIARVEEVKAQKKAKVLAAQLARAEKESATKHWEQAIAALNEALLTAPEDESIAARIVKVKEDQLQDRLDAILLRAEKAERSNRWDVAIIALKEYLALKEDAAIQKRLADLIEAKRAAWVKAVLARAEQAASNQKWDEALVALNEVLQAEPSQAEVKAKAEEIRAARQAFELNEILKRAESAARASRWDEAIGVLNSGLASYPDHEGLQAKLAEARKAKREAHLQAVLRLADSAAQAGKWEAAVASLNEALANEPDNAAFQSKLREIQQMERESKLNALRAQAGEALQAEKFEEALSAWNEYLATNPDDAEEARAEIQSVKQAQTLASLYAEAKGARAKRDYEKAIDLFKRVVVLDADYKDATDLLAESVRLRRAGSKALRTFNRKAWLTGGLIAVLVLGIGAAVFWVGKNGLPAKPAVGKENTKTPTSAATRATPTAAGISALDPEIQAALDVIQNEEPLYQTSFDDWDSEDTGRNAALVNGKLMLTSKDENGAHFPLNAYPSDKYVVEFEIDMSTSINGNCFYGAGNGVPPGESFRGFTMEFYPEGLAALARYVPETGLDVRLATTSFDKTKPNMVTLVVLGDQITAFINGQLAYTALNHVGSVVYVSHGLSAYNQATCEFDDFKYWDLRDMGPAVKTALATTQNEEPLYQTGFDSWDFGDPVENARVENGKLIVLGGENQSTYVSHSYFQSNRFAIQFEIQILESGQGGACLLNIGADDGHSIRNIFMPSGELEVDHLEVDGNEITIGNAQFDPSNVSAATVIVLNDQISVFVDGELAFTAHDPEASAVYANVTFEADSHMTCEFDNFKIWNLRGLDTATLTALAAIQNAEPLYQTSFDSWDDSWNSNGNTKVENGKLIVASENQQYAGLDLSKLASDKYAVEFEMRISDPGPGHCLFHTANTTDTFSPLSRALSPGFSSDGSAWLGHYVHPDQYPDLASSRDRFDFSKTNTVTLIFLGQKIAALINGQIAYTAVDSTGSDRYIRQEFGANFTIGCEYDNYKIWDLSGVDFSAATGAPAPEEVTIFYEPILTYIESQSPTFEDDFSARKNQWGNTSEGIPVSEMNNAGILSISKNSGERLRFPLNGLFNATDFAIQFDVEFNSDMPVTNIGFQFRTSTDQHSHYKITFFDKNKSTFLSNPWQFIETTNNQTRTTASGYKNLKDGFNEILIIARQGNLAIFVDADLLYLGENITIIGHENLFIADAEPSNDYIRMDNIKFWNLDGVDFSAATTTTGTSSSFASILDSIAGKTPDYEDDFSNPASGWPTRSGAKGETGYQDGKYFISARYDCYGADLPTNLEFSDFVLETDAQFINQGEGTVSIFFRNNSTASYGANLFTSGWFNFHKNVNGIHTPLLEAEVPKSSFQAWDTPKRLTLIVRQDRMAIYVNGDLIIAQADTSSSQGIIQFGVCSDDSLQVLIDNLKIWDITDLSP